MIGLEDQANNRIASRGQHLSKQDVESSLQYSIAISLKRIADNLDKQNAPSPFGYPANTIDQPPYIIVER